MTSTIDRLLTLSVGILTGVIVMLGLSNNSDEGERVKEFPDLEMSSIATPPAISSDIRVDQDNRALKVAQNEPTQKGSVEEVEFGSNVSPISIPAVYEDLVAQRHGQPRVSFADIHKIFKNEPRDEPWAAAMESGINHYLANSGTGEWAVVEYVECRSKICEIAGYTTGGDDNHHSDLISDFLRSGLWQGKPITHSSGFGNTDLKRFIIIISGYSYSEYSSVLSSL